MNELLLLIIGHYVCDFGLQNDFTAKAKNPFISRGDDNTIWVHVMSSHCAIQALPVLLVTHSWELALAEFLFHFYVDFKKCKGSLDFHQDQALHLASKIVWWTLWRLVQ
jgi:hypothetical protein